VTSGAAAGYFAALACSGPNVEERAELGQWLRGDLQRVGPPRSGMLST